MWTFNWIISVSWSGACPVWPVQVSPLDTVWVLNLCSHDPLLSVDRTMSPTPVFSTLLLLLLHSQVGQGSEQWSDEMRVVSVLGEKMMIVTLFNEVSGFMWAEQGEKWGLCQSVRGERHHRSDHQSHQQLLPGQGLHHLLAPRKRTSSSPPPLTLDLSAPVPNCRLGCRVTGLELPQARGQQSRPRRARGLHLRPLQHGVRLLQPQPRLGTGLALLNLLRRIISFLVDFLLRLLDWITILVRTHRLLRLEEEFAGN